MNLTEKMALDCGIKISTPFIDRSFVPLKNDKFIIFDTRSRYETGEYDYYADILELIKPYLQKENIDVIQLCHEKSYKLPANKCFIGLSKKQEAYLISKAKVLIANQNYSLYIAATLNIKSIGLYSIFRPQNVQPVWNKDSQIIFEADRFGNPPSYGLFNENPKTINYLDPYKIAKNILDELNIANDLHRYEVVILGKNYNQKIIEIVPDFISEPNFLQDSNINLRLDLVKDLNIKVFNYWVSNRKVNLITDKDINIQLLANSRKNVYSLAILISDSISEDFLNKCKGLGINIKIFCDNPEKINDYRFKFLNWNIESDFGSPLKLSNFKNISANSKFISSKVLISRGKQFSCKANFLKNVPLDNNQENVIFSKDFEEELDYFKIYNEK